MDRKTAKIVNIHGSLLYRFVDFFLLCTFLPLYGPAQQNPKPHLEIETDPLAYVLRGYSAHAAITYGEFRTSVGVYGIEPPDFLKGNDAFYVFTSGFDFKTDYLFGSARGVHAGIQATYSRDRIGLIDATYRENLWGLNIGIRGGYRFLFGKAENHYRGFYIAPWAALMYNPSPKTVRHGDADYKQAAWFPFPTLHVGWRF